MVKDLITYIFPKTTLIYNDSTIKVINLKLIILKDTFFCSLKAKSFSRDGAKRVLTAIKCTGEG